jgi:hypothetical protein
MLQELGKSFCVASNRVGCRQQHVAPAVQSTHKQQTQPLRPPFRECTLSFRRGAPAGEVLRTYVAMKYRRCATNAFSRSAYPAGSPSVFAKLGSARPSVSARTHRPHETPQPSWRTLLPRRLPRPLSYAGWARTPEFLSRLSSVLSRRSLTGSSRAIGFIGATPIPKSGVRVPKGERLL